MTAGLPVVTTAIGEEGVGGTHGIHYMVAKNVEEMVACTVRLLLNPTEATKMGENARDFMGQRQNFAGRLANVEQYLEQQVEHARES